MAFPVSYDRDRVLERHLKLANGCYDRVETSRWVCPQTILDKKVEKKKWSLDDALEYFKYDRRAKGAKHCAVQDAEHAGTVYMELCKRGLVDNRDLVIGNEEEV